MWAELDFPVFVSKKKNHTAKLVPSPSAFRASWCCNSLLKVNRWLYQLVWLTAESHLVFPTSPKEMGLAAARRQTAAPLLPSRSCRMVVYRLRYSSLEMRTHWGGRTLNCLMMACPSQQAQLWHGLVQLADGVADLVQSFEPSTLIHILDPSLASYFFLN